MLYSVMSFAAPIAMLMLKPSFHFVKAYFNPQVSERETLQILTFLIIFVL
jgi:hypothetical protein